MKPRYLSATLGLITLSITLMAPRVIQAVPVHLHTLQSITWCSGANIASCVANPNLPHQHYNTLRLWDAGLGIGQFDGYADWDNETFTPDANQEANFNHGFIVEEVFPAPDFWFSDTGNVGVWTTDPEAILARPRITGAFGTWSNLEAGVSPVSGLPLDTGILFLEAGNQAAAEITIYWGTPAQYPILVSNDAAFCQVAAVCPGFPNHSLFFSENTSWYFGANAAGMPLNSVDLITVALHEIGHIVGLDHQNDTDDVMYTFAGDQARIAADAAFRALSADDMVGAYSLYSIPSPEPSTLLLLSSGLAVAVGLRKRLN